MIASDILISIGSKTDSMLYEFSSLDTRLINASKNKS